MLCLSAEDVTALLSLESCIDVVEQAFASYALGTSYVYPVVREVVPDSQGIFGVKAGLLGDQKLLGLKAGGFWANNRRSGLSSHQSVILLFNPANGKPLALVDANVITRLRTAAVGALALRYLAPPNASRAALIGCGVQGLEQVRGLRLAQPSVGELRYYDVSADSLHAFGQAIADLGITACAARSIDEAVDGADIIITTTPSWEPLVRAELVKQTAHISAFGADTRGKQELDPELYRRARVVVDSWSQAIEIGETQHAHRQNLITRESLYAEFGELCAGLTAGRGAWDGLTILDATGIALQDLAAAGLVLELAQRHGAGVQVEL